MTNLALVDVTPRRRERLRARCHAVLQAQTRGSARRSSIWTRVVGPTIAAMWGIAYFLKTLQVALATLIAD